MNATPDLCCLSELVVREVAREHYLEVNMSTEILEILCMLLSSESNDCLWKITFLPVIGLSF